MQGPSSPSPSPSQAEELRLARERIAVLEQEVAALRSATPTPTPSSPPHTSSPSPKPRPVIMTRRAAAAAAAAAAAVSAGSAVAADLTANPSTILLAPKPRHPDSSALSDSRIFPDSAPSPTSSEISVDASELSSSASAIVDLHPDPASSEALDQPSPITDDTSDPQLSSTDSLSSPEQQHTQVGHSDVQMIEAVTPEFPSLPAAPQKTLSHDDRHFLTTSLVSTPKSPSPSPQLPNSSSTAEPSEKSKTAPAPSQKRRPPPLPVVKTASTKKERHNIVAKCTEPRPGQTRYWTEEEHERFLEAVAEYGEKAYVAISNYVETRTPKQVRTHAQKFQMKMARLAKQSIEAGEPIQMPAGMNPVIQVPTADGKSTLVPLPSNGQTADVLAKLGHGIPGHVPVIVAAPPSKAPGKKRSSKKPSGGEKEKPEDALVKMSSVVSDEMSDESASAQTDPYMDYIGGASDPKVELELEHSFAAKLCQTLNGSGSDEDSREDEFLMSGTTTNESTSVSRDDDDLEDLEKLEDGDLSLAAFSNATDNWLLPEASL